MNFISIKKLQREFGLSYIAAANLIEEQRGIAVKRYRPIIVLTLCGMAGFLALTLAGVPSWRDVVRFIPIAMLPLLLAHLYLVNRATRASILAIVAKGQMPGNACASSRSEQPDIRVS